MISKRFTFKPKAQVSGQQMNLNPTFTLVLAHFCSPPLTEGNTVIYLTFLREMLHIFFASRAKWWGGGGPLVAIIPNSFAS